MKEEDEKSPLHTFSQDKEYLFYFFNAQNNKIALDVPLKTDNGIKVTAYPLHGGTHQKYKLYVGKDNYYHIQNLFSLKYLELNASLIQNELKRNNPFQQFKFVKYDLSDLYIVTTKGHTDNLCLDGSNNAFNICKRDKSKKQQQFKIELFNNKAEYQVAPSTYIVWHTELQNKTQNNNKICVMYSIKPLKSHSCTYWSCVFPKGYMGIQDKTKHLKWIIFSIWDAALSDVVDIGHHTKCDLFGGEGVGVRTHIVYKWKIGLTYTFKVVYQTLKDRNNGYAAVSAYFLEGDASLNNEFHHKGFQLIATIRVANDNKYLFDGTNRFTNFTEDWDSGGGNGDIERKALFGHIKILNNDKLIGCDGYHEWCAETRPFKQNIFCVQVFDEKHVCASIGGC